MIIKSSHIKSSQTKTSRKKITPIKPKQGATSQPNSFKKTNYKSHLPLNHDDVRKKSNLIQQKKTPKNQASEQKCYSQVPSADLWQALLCHQHFFGPEESRKTLRLFTRKIIIYPEMGSVNWGSRN